MTPVGPVVATDDKTAYVARRTSENGDRALVFINQFVVPALD